MTADTPWNDRMPWVPGNRWDLVAHLEPDAPRVSVIVTHYAQPRELARTLAALRRQDHPHDRLEIIVADDGSPEPPVVPEGVLLVRQEDRGFRAAAARNLGAAAASGDVLCFLDADTSPEPEYVRRIARLPALLREAVTVGRRRHADFAGVPADAPVEKYGPAHELTEPAWLREAYERSRNLLQADDRSYRYVISAVVACSRAFFDEVGGFDESFSSYGGEDWEWAHRCWQSGAVLAHVPDAVAWHDGPDWAGRGDSEREAEGNRQAIHLATKIPVDGSAGRGLLPTTPDIEVRVPVTTASAAFVCADSILAALPRATVVMDPVPDEPALRADPRIRSARTADARVILTLEQPVVVLRPDELRDALAVLGESGVGSVHLHSSAGVLLGSATSRRARERSRRWGTTSGHSEKTRTLEGMHALRDEPSVEAWLGAWGGPPRFT
ncbi:GT2 family glycosyltransferase [Microbacterium sp. 1154]|uniref:glycosyltransferase family 2 protein n=1 Tax=Microbacterium sp. 1154 TaxID=2817733 RepID=UPI002860575E|nr:glycosyltransferase [Microbacterium sp. 1154]MDR6689102.1 GT2 family glycosyltransferase [Microbacterium sp. 1154]